MAEVFRARMAALELGAIKAIQTIHQAEVQYQSQYNRYANSLQEIGPPASGAATPSAADLIGNDLASGEKGGYKFTLDRKRRRLRDYRRSGNLRRQAAAGPSIPTRPW